MVKKPKENLEATVNFEEPEQPLFVIWNTAPFGTSLLGIKQKEFYFNADLKLKGQLAIQEKFPQALLIPGPWPDFGVAVETSALGCHIEWPENEPPWARPAILSITEVGHMKKPVPGESGITGLMLEQYRYMWDHLDKKYIDDYGFLDGLGYILGPLETAALVVGYGQILFELYDHPREVHQLLQLITDFEIEWLHEQEKVNGKLKRLYMPEHFPTQVSPAHFEEFCFPYISQIFNEFPNAVGLYHNEGNVSHIMERIPEMGAKIFHFGNDIKETKEKIGDKICLMGNLPPVEIMLDGTIEEVVAAAKNCLEVMGKAQGFLLSTAGGMAPGTPEENVEAVLEVLSGWQRESYRQN